MKDMEKELQTATDLDMVSRLHTMTPQGKMVRNIFRPALQHCLPPRQVLDAFSTGFEALRGCDQPVEDPLGPYMKTQLHGIRVANAWPASTFWKWMSIGEMYEMGFNVDNVDAA